MYCALTIRLDFRTIPLSLTFALAPARSTRPGIPLPESKLSGAPIHYALSKSRVTTRTRGGIINEANHSLGGVRGRPGSLVQKLAQTQTCRPRVTARSLTPTGSANVPVATEGFKSDSDSRSDLTAKYAADQPRVRELVARVAEKFGRNAQAIERTDGLPGLVLLDRLDLEAIFLYEKHPTEFRRLRDFLGGDAAADILLHWREYFGLKRADDTDRGILIAEIASLAPAQKRVAATHPGALPLILADPMGVTELVERMAGDEKTLADMLSVLSFISLERGSSDLRSALRTFDRHGPLAVEAFRRHGLEGFALVSLYGPILDALGDAMPLDQSLILLRVNADYVDLLLQTHRPETVAGHLRHVAAAGLTELVGGSPNALRLVVEYGAPGERALKQAGPDAADVVFGDFSDATLYAPGKAVAALRDAGANGPGHARQEYARTPIFVRSSEPRARPSFRRSPRPTRGLRCWHTWEPRRGGRSPSRWLSRRYLRPGIMVRPPSGRSRTMAWIESPN